MSNYKYVLFDLDGTLSDPGEGITNAIMYALDKYDIRVNNRSELYKFIGPPLKESFMKFYGFDESTAEQSVVYYREYFTDKGLYENVVYDGIEDLLQRLKNADIEIILATSKPESFAITILDYFHLSKYFAVKAGATMDGSRIRKGDVIRYAMDMAGIHAADGVIMVGDREHDMIGAKENGLPSIGVLFGYGDKEELTSAGADYLAKSPVEIGDIILG